MEVLFGEHRLVNNEILNIVQAGQQIKITLNNPDKNKSYVIFLINVQSGDIVYYTTITGLRTHELNQQLSQFKLFSPGNYVIYLFDYENVGEYNESFYITLRNAINNFYQKFPNPGLIGKLVAKINFRVKASGINAYPELNNFYGDLTRYIIANLSIYQILDICLAESTTICSESFWQELVKNRLTSSMNFYTKTPHTKIIKYLVDAEELHKYLKDHLYSNPKNTLWRISEFLEFENLIKTLLPFIDILYYIFDTYVINIQKYYESETTRKDYGNDLNQFLTYFNISPLNISLISNINPNPHY
jgi:hypothetical protein